MHYQGGKARLAGKFAHILLAALREQGPGARLIEPFMGGWNVVPALRRAGWEGPAICSDLHPGLPVLYRALQAGWQPPGPAEFTDARWEALRVLEDWRNPETAYAAFGCSYGGIEWQPCNRGPGTVVVKSARGSCLRKARRMTNVTFHHRDYRQAPVTPADVVYLDPPYRDTHGYRGVAPFDVAAFDLQCEAWAEAGARVFVSEFTFPDRPGWVERWSLERFVTITRTKAGEYGRRVDRLAEVVDALR